MSTQTDLEAPFKVLEGGHTFSSLTEKISSIVVKEKIRPGWALGLLCGFFLLHLAGDLPDLIHISFTITSRNKLYGSC